jgi:hypothetical protein
VGLDHFVLVVDVGESGLLLNTTWGTRNGWRIRRRAASRSSTRATRSASRPARDAVLEEKKKSDVVKVRVECAASARDLEVPAYREARFTCPAP